MVSRVRLERLVTADAVLAQFLRGASAALIIGVLSRFISFPINIMLARILGTEHFGTYVFVVSWLGIFLIVGTLGFNVSLLRFVPAYIAEREWQLLRGVLERATHTVLLATLTISAAVALVALVAFDRMGAALAYTLLAGCLALPLAALNKVRQGALRGVNRIAVSEGLDHIFSPTIHALAVLGLFFALGRSISSQVAMLLSALVEFVTLLVGTFLLRRALPAQLWAAGAIYRTREWVRISAPLSFVSGMLMLLGSIDIIVVGIMLGPAAAGIYAVASNLARFTMFGLMASNIAAQPMVAGLYARGDTEGLRRLVVLLVWSSAFLAGLIGAVLFVLHTPLLRLFGPDFAAGSTVMLILIASRVVNSLTGPSGSLLAMTKHQDLNALILGITALVNIPATILGITLAGMEGAALATAASLTFMTVWTWFEVRRRLGINAVIFAGVPFRS